MPAWNHRLYGTVQDPIHKSHLNAITGDYGCMRKFRYAQEERASGTRDEHTVNGKTAAGTALHETLARALANPAARADVLAGRVSWTADQIRRVFDAELTSETKDRLVTWHNDTQAEVTADCVAMITGALQQMHRHVADVVLSEPAFIVRLGDYWLAGHVDLIYRPPGLGLGLADWKSGAQRPDTIELDHSWEAGVYAAAMRHGMFLPREALRLSYDNDAKLWTASTRVTSVTHASRYYAERDALEASLILAASTAAARAMLPVVQFDAYPTAIRYVHLRDYVPYEKAGAKAVTRAEDLAHWGVTTPSKVKYTAGMQRGPAWLHVQQTEADIPRLLSRLRAIVGTIRMGRFIDMVGQRCGFCAYRQPCLNSGYAATGEDLKDVDSLIKHLDLDTGNL